MSLSGWLRVACAAVPAALFCGGAVAQQIITVPRGMTVVLVPGRLPVVSKGSQPSVLVETRRGPSAYPIERIFAEQREMMNRVMADVDAMFAPMQSQPGMIETLLRHVGSPVFGVVPAAGGSFCSESVSISYDGQNSAPLVKVSRAGNGCGPVAGGASVPAQAAPAERHHPNVMEIDSPGPVTQPAARHHT